MKANKTWNQYVVKQENKMLVLDMVRANSTISRAEIANRTGLNKGTVSSLVNELLEEKLINEFGPGESSGGRKPLILSFNHHAGYSIGVDLGVNYILGMVTDLNGNILFEKHSSIHHLTYEETLEELYQMIDTLIAHTQESPYGLIGIGVGVPGIVDKSKKILLAPNLKWENVDLKMILENRYSVPVTIENEANAGAHAERRFGIGKGYHNILYISVGIGIGVGIIIQDELYVGNNGFSGEFGHMTIETSGEKCSCGNVGCWELYASEKALLRGIEGLEREDLMHTEFSLEHIITLAEQDDQQIIEIIESVGKYLGIGINNMINIFNPEQVIIGNRIAKAQPWLQPTLTKWIEEHSLWFSQKDLQIDFAELTTHSTALGVAAFSVEIFLKNHLQKVTKI
ncbi:ROK family transcriptional regulator [Oceanobacillus neutriphilus]|uniref:Xylose repressor n=1 Tax=Oceanobacillus neutriphilus TaxID=531815 RepID=A0ABQ2NND3_9BACI|nr:ROK family transcriptional regulator [Oceanobacillus neutriphilus]GGP07757.1 xylose repressor [Oceanobacillus neutriphilus]